MFQYNQTSFNPHRLLLPGLSTITIGQALVHEQFSIETLPSPDCLAAGAALLAATKLNHVRDEHLEAERVRLEHHPVTLEQKLQRVSWMWHAGSQSSNLSERTRAEAAIDVMTSQLPFDGGLDLETLAEHLQTYEHRYPIVVAALCSGDLDDVPGHIDSIGLFAADRVLLVRQAAEMFVCWAALEQQRTASLGWRRMRLRTAFAGGPDFDEFSSIGQALRPANEQHEFAHRMLTLHARGKALTDKRSINAIEKKTERLGFGWLNRANEKKIVALFGPSRRSLSVELARAGATGDRYKKKIDELLHGPDGASRAGQRTDLLYAPISAVLQTHIVCARLCHIATLAAAAQTTDDLRHMLDAQLPNVLQPSPPGIMDHDKLRLLQMFHVVRCEFIRDPEHRPKAAKCKKSSGEVALELDEQTRRRGHELTDECRKALAAQLSDWRFATPFGWQCGRGPRTLLSWSTAKANAGGQGTPTRATLLHHAPADILKRQRAAATGSALAMLHLAQQTSHEAASRTAEESNVFWKEKCSA